MNNIINWLEPWDELCTEPSSFEKELYKEVGELHILYGKKVSAIGRRYDCDDFLFQIHDSEFKYAVVHLTYSSKKEKSPNWPRTKTFKDINDWIDNCMIPVHEEYTICDE
ncbi:MAG TPA: hypothetical protein VF941_04195 [Clostridia bacterium]